MRKMVLKITLGIAAILVFAFSACFYFFQDPFYYLKPKITIEETKTTTDKDNDGIFDNKDIVEGARSEVINKTRYKSSYYSGGYPPKTEGVCTDVIWRALSNAGYDLKSSIDKDIRENLANYSDTISSPDPNIDFRRVKNLQIFFKGNSESLTIEVIPYDADNLKQWQSGDIVILKDSGHIAVISDKRRKDGVPFIIHNANTVAKEQDLLMKWYLEKRIIGHFRYPMS